MRVLQANKFFYNRGGAEVVFFDTIRGLRERGHEVAEFSTRHPNNKTSAYADYFASGLPELTGTPLSALAAWSIFKRAIHSPEVERKLIKLLEAFNPEIAHLHNVTRQLSASIFKTLNKFDVPIVMTVHDVQPMCPNHRMINGTGALCEKCFQRKFYNCVRYGCVDSSRIKSLAGSLESYYYWLKGIWGMVDLFICPSQFFKDKMAKWGFPEDKLRVIRNSFACPAEPPPLGSKILYLGRLHEEKGIHSFVKALPRLQAFEVVIVGSGPEESRVDNFIKDNHLTNVKMTGWLDEKSRAAFITEAKAVVVPSLFYENCSLTILEAMANGRIVVASNRGGNPELVKHEETGFLAVPGSPESLVAEIKKAMSLPESAALSMRERAREKVKNDYSPKQYVEQLEKLYEDSRLGSAFQRRKRN